MKNKLLYIMKRLIFIFTLLFVYMATYATFDVEDDVDVEFCVCVSHNLLFYLSCRDSRRLFVSLLPIRGFA